MRSLFLSCLVALSLSLGGFGLRPLYASGAQGGVATMLADIDVAPIEGHAGWLVRTALRDRFVAAQGGRGAGTRYRLDVRLEDGITGFGIRSDAAIPRERRTLRARYQLVDGRAGQVLLDATAAHEAGIGFVRSEYATLASQHTTPPPLPSGPNSE